MRTRILVILSFAFGHLFELKCQHPSDKDNSEKICESMAHYFKDHDNRCPYDTLVCLANLRNDSSLIFAVGSLDVNGTSTPFVDIFISKGLRSFKRLLRDTLLTADCVPCDDPREFVSINVQPLKTFSRVVINCSYFYNRHQMAGTIHRSFVYDVSFSAITVHRNTDKEFKLRRTKLGKINGG